MSAAGGNLPHTMKHLALDACGNARTIQEATSTALEEYADTALVCGAALSHALLTGIMETESAEAIASGVVRELEQLSGSLRVASELLWEWEPKQGAKGAES